MCLLDHVTAGTLQKLSGREAGRVDVGQSAPFAFDDRRVTLVIHWLILGKGSTHGGEDSDWECNENKTDKYRRLFCFLQPHSTGAFFSSFFKVQGKL